MRHLLLLVLAGMGLVVFAAAAGAKTPPLVSSAEIDLKRYMGRWWVIAHIPYFAENGKVATADIYALRDDGRIDNVFVYRKGFGKPEKQMHALGTVIPGTTNSRWKIAFFGGLLRTDYLILEVAPDYSWALIGQPSRKLAWVFAREQQMDDATLAGLLSRFPTYGYDPAKLRRVAQSADQLPANAD